MVVVMTLMVKIIMMIMITMTLLNDDYNDDCVF